MHPSTHLPYHLHHSAASQAIAMREHIEIALLTEMKRLHAAGTIDMTRMRAIARHTVAEIKTGASMSELVHGLGTYATAFPEMLTAIKTLLNEHEDVIRHEELSDTISELHQIISSSTDA